MAEVLSGEKKLKRSGSLSESMFEALIEQNRLPTANPTTPLSTSPSSLPSLHHVIDLTRVDHPFLSNRFPNHPCILPLPSLEHSPAASPRSDPSKLLGFANLSLDARDPLKFPEDVNFTDSYRPEPAVGRGGKFLVAPSETRTPYQRPTYSYESPRSPFYSSPPSPHTFNNKPVFPEFLPQLVKETNPSPEVFDALPIFPEYLPLSGQFSRDH